MQTVLVATDSDAVFDEVDAALGGDGTNVARVRTGREVRAAVLQRTLFPAKLAGASLVIGTGATASSFAGSTFLDTADFCNDTSSSSTDPTNAGTGCVAIIDGVAE